MNLSSDPNLEPASSDEINLLIVLAKHKKMILSVTFVAVLLDLQALFEAEPAVYL